ncbi:MAG TPA: hypothetical protein DCM01_09900 [Dielma fastidiosa]|nr:hypothetical protein [Dielma fastidiosa]
MAWDLFIMKRNIICLRSVITRQYWGHGFATETMKAILDFAKNTLELKVIVARYAKANKASEKVLTKLGFSFVKEIVFEANEGRVSYEGVECQLKFE